MNSLIEENHQKISIGRTTRQLLNDLRDRGQELSKRHLFRIAFDELNQKERGLVSVAKIATKKGFRNTNIFTKEAVHEILMSVKKIMPEQKKEYLIESTKPKSMSLTEIKQFGLALIGISEAMEVQQKQIEDLREEQDMCRVSAVKDNENRALGRSIVEHRLHEKGLVYEDKSARSTEYAYLFSYLNKELKISRITNLNAKEHQIVRNKMLEIMDWEKIPY